MIRTPNHSRLSGLVIFLAILSTCTVIAVAQDSAAEFHELLREQSLFDAADFAALQQGKPVVKLLPAQDKREVAVSGLVNVKVPAEVFLQSYRESMFQKSNPAILEIGSFSDQPKLEDLKGLTIENRDIEDLKQCVVGRCQLKLSAQMIDRFRKEVDWESPDYSDRATQLFKVMLIDYVRDYLLRGGAALIHYNDKAKEVRLAEEQQALMAASSYTNEVVPDFLRHVKGFPDSRTLEAENHIVWSKIKFGLKPVFAINHITIHKTEKESGPQVLIASKQIYANHYFDSSLGLTAFVSVPGSGAGSFLLYENRSRADGLQGLFGKMKRSIVEDRAVDGLKGILENSKATLHARVFRETESSASLDGGRRWKRWVVGNSRIFLGLFLISAFIALLVLSNYNWKSPINRGAHDLK
jgi:hypothetical protein